MDAMILAAGLGTRLRPLTLTTPKALVEVDGEPMLARVARRLIAAGADRLIVNVSYLADAVEAYVRDTGWRTPGGAPVEVRVSDEPGEPLETGGGLKKAASFFRRSAESGAQGAFLVHNADILTTVDLGALLDAHRASGAVATLAVAPATTDRYLVVDDAGLLGYAYDGQEHTSRDAQGEPQRVDFCGVQAAGPELLEIVEAAEDDTFSIMTTYLRLAATPGRVAVYAGTDAAPNRFLDVGTPERLEAAHQAVAAGDFA